MSDVNDVTFETWANLASTDPQRFETLRRDKISALIERTTGARQKRLRGLQWKIDQIRDSRSTMEACLAISELMWETFEHLAEILKAQVDNQPLTQTPTMNADIIPFPSIDKNQN